MPVRADAVEIWKRLKSDTDARFDAELRFDAGEVAPRVTWGTSPEQSIPIDGVVPDPTDAAALVPAASVSSAFAEYQPYQDKPPGSWKELNRAALNGTGMAGMTGKADKADKTGAQSKGC